MQKIILIVFIFFIFISSLFANNESDESGEQTEERILFQFNLTPKIGLTFMSLSQAGNQEENLQWLSSVESNLSFEDSFFQLNTDLFAQYGQIHKRNELPVKSSDDFIFNFTPSITIIRKPSIRVFFKTTLETDMGDGEIDTQKTHFMDPAFLSQTIFLGQKQFLISQTENQTFELTYGIGYAFQQTISRNYKFYHSQADPSFETGYSAVFDVKFMYNFTDNLNYYFNLSSSVYTKQKFFSDINNSRAGFLITSGITYSFLDISYTGRLLYDKNISPTRQFEQSLVLSAKVNI